jgi:hypothetical protein
VKVTRKGDWMEYDLREFNIPLFWLRVVDTKRLQQLIQAKLGVPGDLPTDLESTYRSGRE